MKFANHDVMRTAPITLVDESAADIFFFLCAAGWIFVECVHM